MQIYKIFRYAPHFFFQHRPKTPSVTLQDPTPSPATYVVVSQKVRGVGKKFTHMEFNSSGQFTGLIAQPLDEKDVQ